MGLTFLVQRGKLTVCSESIIVRLEFHVNNLNFLRCNKRLERLPKSEISERSVLVVRRGKSQPSAIAAHMTQTGHRIKVHLTPK